MMQSRSAQEADVERDERVARMTPAERVALAAHLGEEGLAAHMARRGIDRRSAIAEIKAARRLGRRPSASDAQ
jgi:hypothetical protein